MVVLFKSKDYAAKVNFLNRFYFPAHYGGLKSYKEKLQLGSIVTNAWLNEIQMIEKSPLFTCYFKNEGKSIYPNPVVDVLNVEIDNFDETMCVIRNLNGQIVLQSNFQNRKQLHLSGTTADVYFVKLFAQNIRLQISKIVKQ